MRRFLTALITLSILVMAQNVLAITEVTEEVRHDQTVVVGLISDGALEASRSASQPEPISMALLLVGLAGLTAAGDPRPGRRSTRPKA